MSERERYEKYQRTAVAEMAEWHPGFDMTGVSVSEADQKAGSPKAGDMIARNPKNHEDRWLVAADYFVDNFASLLTTQSEDVGEAVMPPKMRVTCPMCEGSGFIADGIERCVGCLGDGWVYIEPRFRRVFPKGPGSV